MTKAEADLVAKFVMSQMAELAMQLADRIEAKGLSGPDALRMFAEEALAKAGELTSGAH
jgi:hypothetical protein